jgi:hypothetical protein
VRCLRRDQQLFWKRVLEWRESIQEVLNGNHDVVKGMGSSSHNSNHKSKGHPSPLTQQARSIATIHLPLTSNPSNGVMLPTIHHQGISATTSLPFSSTPVTAIVAETSSSSSSSTSSSATTIIVKPIAAAPSFDVPMSVAHLDPSTTSATSSPSAPTSPTNKVTELAPPASTLTTNTAAAAAAGGGAVLTTGATMPTTSNLSLDRSSSISIHEDQSGDVAAMMEIAQQNLLSALIDANVIYTHYVEDGAPMRVQLEPSMRVATRGVLDQLIMQAATAHNLSVHMQIDDAPENVAHPATILGIVGNNNRSSSSDNPPIVTSGSRAIGDDPRTANNSPAPTHGHPMHRPAASSSSVDDVDSPSDHGPIPKIGSAPTSSSSAPSRRAIAAFSSHSTPVRVITRKGILHHFSYHIVD